MKAVQFFAFVATLLCSISASSQLVCGLGQVDQCAHEQCRLEADTTNKFTFIPPPEGFVPDPVKSANIVVNYNGFTTNAEIAFQYAVDIWAASLTSTVNIVINANYVSLSPGVLGSAGPATIDRNFSGAPEFNTWYPQALANALAGTDLNPSTADVNCNFNNSFSWYFGLDGNTPGGQYDFVTVVLHELGHGLGFVGSGGYSGGTGFIGQSGSPYIYDTFVENGGGTSILSFASGTTALGDQLTSNNLYWNGAIATANNFDVQPRLYAPSNWNGGSSFSHLNESTYSSGTINSLMTPQLGAAEAVHDPGPITIGMFQDMAWSTDGCAIDNITPTTQFPCDPATNTYTQQVIVEYSANPSAGFLNINGTNYPIFSSPQLITLNSLPADGLPVTLFAQFTAFETCAATFEDLFDAPQSCCAFIRIDGVNPDTGDITLKNWGTCGIDISNYEFSASLTEELVGNLSVVSGSLLLDPDATVTVNWPFLQSVAAASDLCLYLPNSNLVSPLDIQDFVQWGSTGNGREDIGEGAGLWFNGDFLDGLAPFTYIGDGSENGSQYWEVTPPPCAIDNLIVGLQTGCDPIDDSYTQELVFNSTSSPATGFLNVNGLDYSYTGDVVTVILDLTSDGQTVDVTAFYTDEPGCAASFPAAFTAPEACIDLCPEDLSGDDLIDIQDLLQILADYGCIGVCPADLNNDGATNTADILMLIAQLGTSCPTN